MTPAFQPVTAMIPVRIGSERLPQKNLVEIHGRPLMAYAIRAAIEAGVFDRVIVNGDDPVFEGIARAWGADFYLRPRYLGASDVRSDAVVADFIEKHDPDVVAWVNTTTPLQTAEEIHDAVTSFFDRSLDSLITAERRYSHAELDGEPVNFRRDEPFAKTQDLVPVDLFNYATMMWRSATFMDAFESDGFGLFCGRFGAFPISKAAGLMVKHEADVRLIEAMLTSRQAAERPLRRVAVAG